MTVFADRAGGYCRVTFPDGSYSEARPQHDQEYRERAGWLGYPMTEEGLRACAVEHDALHAKVSELLGPVVSPMLHAVAQKRVELLDPDASGFEESLVMEVQQWINTGVKGATLRVLAWRGYNLTALRPALRFYLRQDDER